jgi:oxygen tolerance protein BatD
MRYGIIILLNIVFVLVQGVVHAEDISFIASVNRETISKTDQLTYTLTIETSNFERGRKFKIIRPDFAEFEVLSVDPNIPHFSPINNQTKYRKSIDYLLMPIDTGTFTIPKAKLEYGGKTKFSNRMKVTVVQGPVPSPTIPATQVQYQAQIEPKKRTTPAPEPINPIFIQTKVDKNSAFVNEQITLTRRLFYDHRIYRLEYPQNPQDPLTLPTVGFTQVNLGGYKKSIQDLQGLLYDVLKLSTAIFPISSGEVTIEPAELKINILIRRGGFFGYTERQPFVLRSEPIKMTIKPLPQKGRPDDFKGAVGDFRLDLAASPRAVKVGEPITVTMAIKGAGNLDTVFVPEINCEDAFKTYDPEIGVKRGVRGDRVSGEKIFKQVIIPLSVVAKEIPAISFSFFNPATGKYRTITKPPILIKVGAAPDQGPVALIEGAGSGPGRERIKLLEKDILYIKENPGRLTCIGQFYYHRPRYWIIPIAALAGLLAIWGIQIRREKLRSDLVYARQVGASRSARKRFKKARAFLNAGDSEKFYGEVHRAFNRYLGDKLGIPSGAVEGTIVAEKLLSAGAVAEIIKEVEACFSDFDLARFARSSSDKNEMNDFLDKVEGLISKLGKIKIKSFQ